MKHKSAWIFWKFQKKVFVNRSNAHLPSVGALSKNHLWNEERYFLQYQEPEPGFPLLKRKKTEKLRP